MSYTYQITGTQAGAARGIDYSRFDSSDINVLDENSIREQDGVYSSNHVVPLRRESISRARAVRASTNCHLPFANQLGLQPGVTSTCRRDRVRPHSS